MDLDRARVERAYLARLGGAHPDLGGEAVDASAINEARDVLIDPERRANLLLALRGGPGASECKDLPEGFLMEMMELRQTIEEEVDADPEGARAKWERWGRERREAHAANVSAMLDGDADLRDVRVELNAWRYIERLIEQLDPDYDPARVDGRG